MITEQERLRTCDLERLVAEANRIEGWLSLPLPEGLGDLLRTERRRVNDDLATLLVAWRRTGGTVELRGSRPLGLETTAAALAVAETGADEAPREPDASLQNADTSGLAAEAQAGMEPASPPSPPPVRPLAVATKSAPLVNPQPSRPSKAVDLSALVTHLAMGGNFGAGPAAPDWRVHYSFVVSELELAEKAGDEVGALVRIVDGHATWSAFSDDAQVLLVTWLAARCRVHQDQGSADERLDGVVRRLSAYQQRQRNGFVHGLARTHRPKSASWQQDAAAAWRGLLEFLPERTAAPPLRTPAAPRPKATRVAKLETAKEADDDGANEDEGDDNRPGPSLDEWPWRAWTEGRRAVIVGGDPREPNRLKLVAAFGFAELTWEGSARTRRNALQRVRERVRAGKLDMVLILSRFVGHSAENVIQPACKEAGVAFVPVQTGYGVGGVRRAIERHLAANEPQPERP